MADMTSTKSRESTGGAETINEISLVPRYILKLRLPYYTFSSTYLSLQESHQFHDYPIQLPTICSANARVQTEGRRTMTVGGAATPGYIGIARV